MYLFIGRRLGWLLVCLALVLSCTGQYDLNDTCAVCGTRLAAKIYLFTDKVSGEVKKVCGDCAALPTTCYLCGMPVKDHFRELPDGRVICERDARAVVLDGPEGQQIFNEVDDTLNRLFARFITFPSETVAFALTDRVNIQNLFKFAGNDYTCPNVWGYYTMNSHPEEHDVHQIVVLSGLPRNAFRATCAHELTHAWVHENVSAIRLAHLSHDAHEGFCELIAYNLAKEQRDEVGMRTILANLYTRGQINVYIAAQEKYGFNDVVDWVRFGEEDHLDADNLDHLHRLTDPRSRPYVPGRASVIHYPPAPPTPDHLVLKGILWSAKRPMASINGRLFGEHQTVLVPLADTNVMVRCLAIREEEVEVQLVESGAKQVLKFKE